MRALLGVLCLFAGLPADRLGGQAHAARPERMAEIGALLADIAPGHADSGPAKELPRDLDEALTTWIALAAQPRREG